MRTIERSIQFKKDYKKYFKSVYGSELDARLKKVIGHLLAEQPLPIKFRDHQLRANWKGYRDCHVFPDLVLIYQLQGGEVLRLVRLGSHSELSL